jgi:hypothetical protein
MLSALDRRFPVLEARVIIRGTTASAPICNAPTVSVVAVAHNVTHSRVVTPGHRMTALHVSHNSKSRRWLSIQASTPVFSILPENICCNMPITDLGGPCASSNDCEGFDYSYGTPTYCGKDSKCGGTDAACQANVGTAEGESYVCVSRKLAFPSGTPL